MNPSREGTFDVLCDEVQCCTKCLRMGGSARILSLASGPLDAKVMFVGEAPGRLGADASGIPFHGDKAGENFEDLLRFSGLSRSDVFITNAVLCNPKDEDGNNATPSSEEIGNCSTFLRRQIEVVDPQFIVTLGAKALEALAIVEPHKLVLRDAVRTKNRWFGRVLIPLYHPGRRAMIHRSHANQRADYQFVAEKVRRVGLSRRVVAGQTAGRALEVASLILRRKRVLSYFSLHKLFYLVECQAVRRFGGPITDAFFIRQKDGPYCTDLHIDRLRKAIPRLSMRWAGQRLMLAVGEGELFERVEEQDGDTITREQAGVIEEVLTSTENLDDGGLKGKCYLSAPMREILRVEKREQRNMFNRPIEFGALVRGQNAQARAAAKRT